MSISCAALLVVLATSVGWSAFDLLRKMLVETLRPVPMLVLLTLAQSLFFAVWVVFDGSARLTSAYWLPALGSVALNVVANVAMVEALSLAPLSLTIPLLSLTPAVTALVATLVLDERLAALQTAGIVLVVLGALRLHLDPGRRVSLGSLGRALREQRGTQLMVVVAIFWSVAMPLDKLALRASSTSVHALGLSLGVALGTLAILAARRELAELAAVRRRPGLFTAGLLVSAVTTVLQIVAIQLVWVGLVEAIKRSVGNLAALVLGRTVFGEAITPAKVVAVAMMAVGVVMILR